MISKKKLPLLLDTAARRLEETRRAIQNDDRQAAIRLAVDRYQLLKQIEPLKKATPFLDRPELLPQEMK